jgi:hypothetical protein
VVIFRINEKVLVYDSLKVADTIMHAPSCSII